MGTTQEKNQEANAIRLATSIQHAMDSNHTNCRDCGEPAFWAKTSSGKPILMDYTVKPNGTYRLKPLLHSKLLAQFVSLTDLKSIPKATPLYVSHWDVCEKRKKTA